MTIRSTTLKILLATAFLAISISAQNGGKAEPKRIEFAAGRTSAVVAGSLSNGQETEYVFSASKGQVVTVKNSKTSLFDFRIFSDEFDLETEFESSSTLTITVPETGDYMFFVRKKMVRSPRRAAFSLTLYIK